MWVPFLIALAGNLYLVGLFLSALLYPTANVDFIFRTGALVFVMEFLSIHSSGMIEGSRLQQQTPPKISPFALIGLYCVMALACAAAYHNWTLPLLFVVSVLAKYFGRRASASETSMTALFAIIFLLTAFVTVFTAPLFARLFPFSSSVMAHQRGSGVFERVPQALLGWGVLYYFLVALAEAILFFKTRKIAAT